MVRSSARFQHLRGTQVPGPDRPCGRRLVYGTVLAIAFLVFGGCAPLEPMAEPEVSDLELTVETLKTAVRDAQRTVAELRTELEGRRKELAEAQVARAQLEGRVREAERRLVEARQVVELQREELAAARNEREHVAKTGRQLQSQLKQLQKQMTDKGKRKPNQAGASPATLPSRSSGGRSANSTRVEQTSISQGRPPALPSRSAEQVGEEGFVESSMDQQQAEIPPSQGRSVFIRPGDTLWRIAQRYRVEVNELRSLNQLPDNHILPGQVLWLPASRSMGRSMPETGIMSGR